MSTETSGGAFAHRPGGWKDLSLRRSGRLVERHLLIYRHTPGVLVAEIFEPLLYLLAIGVGIGHLVGDVPGVEDSADGYSAFVAPALLATAAMNGAMNETTFNLLRKLRVDRIYDSVLTTPMTVSDIALGEVCWAVLRGTLTSTGFLAVIAALGLVQSPWAVLVIPCAALVGFAFAAVGLAVTTFLRGWQDFQYIQLAMLPMFLFATTFYPLDVYPRPVQAVVACLPLYQSIELTRGIALGRLAISLPVAVAYLVLMGLAGLVIARGRLARVLLR
ncbi:ABC transporter permease [Streptomyces sp. WMMC500]|uniref:ABC transporter permease n=1 Tax=Streptomyces sp. WMMC500 TaxID=3015154 RepID=UPI00248B4DCA|nr:ABC transporter permease [Streptomyces sp. WMMC500]WBB60783.1 ABC transporter permease [Streptomyces sp. WMMC500]